MCTILKKAGRREKRNKNVSLRQWLLVYTRYFCPLSNSEVVRCISEFSRFSSILYFKTAGRRTRGHRFGSCEYLFSAHVVLFTATC